MTVIRELTQGYVDQQLRCPPGKTRIEIVDPQRTGLYIEVRASTHGKGTYYVRYKDSQKKTCHHKLGRTTELTLEEARAAAVGFRSSLIVHVDTTALNPAPAVFSPPQPHVVSEGAETMTLDTFMMEHYMPHAKAHKRSVGRDEQLYRLRIKAKFGHLPLKGITRLGVQQFQNALAEEGLAKASVNQHAQLLRRVCNLALSWEMLEKNVLTRIPLFTLDNQVDRYLDDEQVVQLVNVLKTDKNRMVSLTLLFLLATGARLNEALCAKWRRWIWGMVCGPSRQRTPSRESSSTFP